MRTTIDSPNAPKPIGTYTQAQRVNNLVFMSGQAPIDPQTGKIAGDDIETQIRQSLSNLKAVSEEAGGSLSDVVKVTVYLTDFNNFAIVNTCMADFFQEPYPARAAVGANALPANAGFAIEAIMLIDV